MRDIDRFRDRREMAIDALLRRLVVIRRDREHRVGADTSLRAVSAIASAVELEPAPAITGTLRSPPRRRFPPRACALHGSASPIRLSFPQEPDRAIPRRSARTTRRRNAASSTVTAAKWRDECRHRAFDAFAQVAHGVLEWASCGKIAPLHAERQGRIAGEIKAALNYVRILAEAASSRGSARYERVAHFPVCFACLP